MKYLIITLVTLLSLNAFGQKIHFTDTSNRWTQRITSILPGSSASYSFQYYAYTGDTSIQGNLYHELISGGAFVREDTTAGHVYIRLYNSVAALDSSEQLLYNYNLGVNDTIHHHNMYASGGTITSWVLSIDSTKINGTWYRVWYFEGRCSFYVASDPNFKYYVIEGLGCTNGFLNPLNPIGVNNDAYSSQLICFSTQGTQPALSNGVKAFGPALFGGAVFVTFDNAASCTLSTMSEAAPRQRHEIIPNPVDATSKLIFAEKVTGSLIIYNGVGQRVADLSLIDQKDISIGDRINNPGIYYYRVVTTGVGQVLSGNFVKQ